MLHVAETKPLPVLLQNPSVPLRLGRFAAFLALACLLAHIPVIAGHFAPAPIMSAVMGAVSLLCIPCARKMWCAPTTQDSAIAATLAAVMIGLHLFLGMTMAAAVVAPSSPDLPMPAHHRGHTAATLAPAQSSTPTEVHHHMAMSGTIGVIFYLATAMAAAQILLNVVAIAITVRRTRADTHAITGHDGHLQAPSPS